MGVQAELSALCFIYTVFYNNQWKGILEFSLIYIKKINTNFSTTNSCDEVALLFHVLHNLFFLIKCCNSATFVGFQNLII